MRYDKGVLYSSKPREIPAEQQQQQRAGSAQRLIMESSGGISLPSFPGSFERMPSFAESDSAFSNATEAESEMTEGGGGADEGFITPRQTYFMCYATDLLSAYEQIKKRSLSGVRAIDDVSAVRLDQKTTACTSTPGVRSLLLPLGWNGI